LFVFVFFSFIPALKALVSAKVSIFFLKIRVKWNIGIVCFIIELHQFTSGTPYIPQKRKQNLQIWSLYHSRDRLSLLRDVYIHNSYNMQRKQKLI
jgi:hypothetical protein